MQTTSNDAMRSISAPPLTTDMLEPTPTAWALGPSWASASGSVGRLLHCLDDWYYCLYIYITSYDYILYTHIGLIYYIIHSIYQCIESKSTEFHEFMGPFIVLSSKANNISISNSLMPFVWTAIKFVQVGQNGMQRGTGKSYTENLRKASNTALFSALHIFRNNCFGDHTSYPDHMLKSIKSPTVLSLRLVRFPCIEAWADHITNPRLACELIHL